MGPNTKILTKRDRALIWTPFDSVRKNKQFKIKAVKIGLKMIELCPLMSRLKSGIWPVLNIDFKFVLPCIYNKIDRQTK